MNHDHSDFVRFPFKVLNWEDNSNISKLHIAIHVIKDRIAYIFKEKLCFIKWTFNNSEYPCLQDKIVALIYWYHWSYHLLSNILLQM